MVSVSDAVRWLHEDGLKRLSGIAGRLPHPIAAYTIDVGSGDVTAHPATGVGLGSDVMTLAADDLPYPAGTPGRLVIVGSTSTGAVLVLDLSSTLSIGINGDNPEGAARSWAMQLILNPDVSLTTNSAAVAMSGSLRYRHAFIPGGHGVIINVDDRRPPITTVGLNPATDGPDHLDVGANGTGELYLGARFWQLTQVLTIDDDAWSALSSTMQERATENA